MTKYTTDGEDNFIISLSKVTPNAQVSSVDAVSGTVSVVNTATASLVIDRYLFATNTGATVGFVSQAQWLIIEKTALTEILDLRMVKFYDAETVMYAKSNGTYADARPIGITLTSAPIGGKVKILILGLVEDVSFNYSANTLLFLGPNGTITNIPPTTGYSVVIGEALAQGIVSLSIRPPIGL